MSALCAFSKMALRKDCLLFIYVLIFSFDGLVLADNDTESTTSSEKSSSTTEGAFSILYTTSQAPHESNLMNETLREIQQVIDDSGRIAGIIIGVLSGLTIVLALVGFCVYKQYLRRNITSMNFDNPVYRKTTEDQFSLEKNQYQPARSYPSSLEPLTSPGTNEFV